VTRCCARPSARRLSDLLVDYRSDEWARFCGYVTDWEKDTYWEDAP